MSPSISCEKVDLDEREGRGCGGAGVRGEGAATHRALTAPYRAPHSLRGRIGALILSHIRGLSLGHVPSLSAGRLIGLAGLLAILG